MIPLYPVTQTANQFARELHDYCMSSFSSHAYKYLDFRSTVKASAAERTLSLLPIALSLLPHAHLMDSARVAIPMLYICWNVFFGQLVVFCTVSRLV